MKGIHADMILVIIILVIVSLIVLLSLFYVFKFDITKLPV